MPTALGATAKAPLIEVAYGEHRMHRRMMHRRHMMMHRRGMMHRRHMMMRHRMHRM